MSHQTFICCICGEQTTKPKSYAIPNKGRACRTHQEAQAGREETLKLEQQKQADRKRKEEEKFNRIHRHFEEQHQSQGLGHYRNPRTFCWCCTCDGIMFSEFNLRVLIISEKLSIQGRESLPLTSNGDFVQELRKEFGDKRVIKIFPLSDDYPDTKLERLFNSRSTPFMAAKFGRLLVLCQECAEKHQFDWDYDRPNLDKMDLSTMAIIYADVEPTLTTIATAEIAKEEIAKAAERTQTV